MKLTKFAQPLKQSATLAINQKALRMRQKGGETAEFAHFGFGEAPFPVPVAIQSALAENTHQRHYLPGLGILELRAQIAEFHATHLNYPFAADHIGVGPGSKELIFHALTLLHGDLILPAPSWVSYAPQANILKKRVIWAPTTYQQNYQLSPQTLRQCAAKARSGQKILILNSPNNPTGQHHRTRDLAALAEVIRDQDIVVISDEIYALLDFAGNHQSLIQHCPERVIVTGGLSKAFSAGGYRLGFLGCQNPDFMAQLARLVSETFSCVSAPIQHAALRAYAGEREMMDYINACKAIHRLVLGYAHANFLEMGLRCHPAHGGFYLFPDFSPYHAALKKVGIRSSEALCARLLDEIQVALLPCEDFGYPAEALAVRAALVDYDGAEVYRAHARDPVAFEANLATHIPRVVRGLARIAQWLKTQS